MGRFISTVKYIGNETIVCKCDVKRASLGKAGREKYHASFE